VRQRAERPDDALPGFVVSGALPNILMRSSSASPTIFARALPPPR
jgi:hypothetical protein